MVEIEEKVVPVTTTSTLIDTEACEGFMCWVKGLFVEGQWQHLAMYPFTSKEISFEDFKEKCRIQVSRTVNTPTKYVALKFCKVELN